MKLKSIVTLCLSLSGLAAVAGAQTPAAHRGVALAKLHARPHPPEDAGLGDEVGGAGAAGCEPAGAGQLWPPARFGHVAVAVPMGLIVPAALGCACGDGGDGKWIKWTYAEYYAYIRCAGRALVKLGLEPFSAVAISGFNSPEWLSPA